MNLNQRIISTIIILVSLTTQLHAQTLQINEFMSTNSNTIYDEDKDSPDWIEIRNTGNSDVNLADYYLSDDFTDLQKWQFPEFILSPQQHLLVFASDKDKVETPVYWNNLIDLGDTWRYKVPDSELPISWKTEYYDISDWDAGLSGIGYGDDDDNTIIPTGSISVFMINKFSIHNSETISKMWLHMDYDDGFVAYLNGVEIARAGLVEPESVVPWNQTATSHEALIYQNQEPEGFDLSDYSYLIKERGNVLAIQVHNSSTGSSDLSAIPFLTVGSQTPFEDPEMSVYIDLPTLYPHTNFKLSSEGESIYLSTTSSIVDSVKYDIIPEGYSYGRSINESEKWGYFNVPTPGSPNNTNIIDGFVKGEIEISPEVMFVSSPVQMVLSGAEDGEEIRYTLDGSEPTENSQLYSSEVTLNDNTPVRARLIIPGGDAGKIVSHTYLFDDVPTLPVISIVTDSLNLWDNETGIYVLGDNYQNSVPYFGANFWEDWEKPASIEMFETNGNSLFSLNCGIKIFGAWSRAHPQKSLSVFFRKDYGDPVLEDVQLFQKKPITKFKSFVLRNSGNDFYQTQFRDAFMTDLVHDINIDMAAAKPIILYLNGEYWGHMNLREKINEEYLESNHGVDADSVDILESNNQIVEGSNKDYLEIIEFIERYNLRIDENYELFSEMIDIENFIDYELSQIYFNNGDWPGNNIKYWRPQTEEGQWRWILYDTDFGFGQVGSYTNNSIEFATDTDGPGWPNPPWSTYMLRKCLESELFKIHFVNRFADMMNTKFVASSVIEKIDSMAAFIEPEVQKTSQKWGTANLNSWNQHVQTMRTFGQNRVSYVRTHIKQKFNLPANHEITLNVSPSNAGNIKLNTLTVAKNNWKGQYFQDIPITLTANSYPGYKFLGWKVNGVTMLGKTIELNITKATTIIALFEESADDGKTIAINEINYNSSEAGNAGDWIELYNWGSSTIDMSGWTLKDDDDTHAFVLPENTVLASRAYIVICRSSDDFSFIHPDVDNYTGEMEFGLGSAGDAVRLFDGAGILVDEVYFASEAPWVSEPNGNGPTLELVNPTYNNNEATNWNSSLEINGTPGRINSFVTGIHEVADNFDRKVLKAFPNPFSNETTIALENGELNSMKIRIISLDGRLVYENVVSNRELLWNGTTNNNQRLKPGIYICNVECEGRLYTEKLILTQ